MMEIKKTIRQLLRQWGIEIRPYTPTTSERARLAFFLKSHAIDLILDVGANEGQYVQFLREIGYQGRVISFEPLSSAYAQLQKTSKSDLLWNLAPPIALGNYEGEVTLNIAGNSQSSSILPMLNPHQQAAPNSGYIGTETVKLSRLDTLSLPLNLSDFQRIFLKVDVQGWEKEVIEGATAILPHIRGMQIELSLVNLYQGQPLYQEMIQWVENLGYHLYSLSPTFSDPQSGRLLQVDGIFFKP